MRRTFLTLRKLDDGALNTVPATLFKNRKSPLLFLPACIE
jgi:hypothetical protein